MTVYYSIKGVNVNHLLKLNSSYGIETDYVIGTPSYMERRRVFAETYGVYKLDYATLDNPFSGRIICGCCGSIFGRKTWHSTNEKLRRKVWMCSNRYKIKGEKSCPNKHIDDKVLYQTFINAFNAIIEAKITSGQNGMTDLRVRMIW
ncbi:zinc ribbon domain-containing protein [Clostridium sp.]|uniref:zinc ribbon domain-containing protein n=1 Tax=Clostridium sp. TaxID=1506 RepID=UPI00321807CD